MDLMGKRRLKSLIYRRFRSLFCAMDFRNVSDLNRERSREKMERFEEAGIVLSFGKVGGYVDKGFQV